MELLISSAIAVATVPAMLFQTFLNLTVRWVVLGAFIAAGLGAAIASPLIEQGEQILGPTVLTKVNAIPIALGFLIILNLLVVPAMYWVDKRRAIVNGPRHNPKNKVNRVPEFSMHFLTAFGGALGAFTSQQIFRHKRSKVSFQMMFFFTVLSSMAIYYFLWLAVEPDLARVDAWLKTSGFVQ